MSARVGLLIAIVCGASCGHLAETKADGGGTGSGSRSGISAAGGTGGGGSSQAGSAGAPTESELLTDEDWQNLVAPRTGPHEVWTPEGCRWEPVVDQDLQILPPLQCSIADDFITSRKRDCDVRPYCETAADCAEEPRGRCEGFVHDKICYYPLPAPQACSEDKDCADAPDGVCRSLSGELNCYPTGPCLERECSYPEKPCETDADCTGAPGGECIHPILFAQCRYNTCVRDADCGRGERCGCGTCVPADCESDSACAEDESCAFSESQCGGPEGYHCTTPEDDCEPDDSHCVFQDGAWRISLVLCSHSR